MGTYPAKSWDILIRAFNSAGEYHAEFTDEAETIRRTFNFDNVETSGDISFAVFLRTLRKNVKFGINYSK